jgi:hypothetical protein
MIDPDNPIFQLRHEVRPTCEKPHAPGTFIEEEENFRNCGGNGVGDSSHYSVKPRTCCFNA